MCYNLATKCSICSEFVDSKVMKCLAHEVCLDVDGIWIRGCQATNTVDGWPFFDQYRLRSPNLTCPNGGTLRLHDVRVLDALCYTCKIDNPGCDDPNDKDSYVGERCGGVFAADFERNAMHYVGSYLHLGAKAVTGNPKDIATYFVFFTEQQLEDWFTKGRKKIDTSQEYFQEDCFPYAASKLDQAYCAETDQWQHAIIERNNLPVAKLGCMGSPWSPQPPPTGLPQKRKRTAEDMELADPHIRFPPVVPTPRGPLTAPQLQHSGDFLESISRQASQDSARSAPPTLAYGTSVEMDRLSTPGERWSPLIPICAVADDKAHAEVAAGGGSQSFVASTYTGLRAHDFSMSPDAGAPSGTREGPVDITAVRFRNAMAVNSETIQLPIMAADQPLTTTGALGDAFSPLSNVADDGAANQAWALQNNALGRYFDTIVPPAHVDNATTNGVQESAIGTDVDTLPSAAVFDGANAIGIQENTISTDHQFFDLDRYSGSADTDYVQEDAMFLNFDAIDASLGQQPLELGSEDFNDLFGDGPQW